MRLNDAQSRIHGLVSVFVAPISCQGRVKHISEPMQQHGLFGLTQNSVVNTLVIGRRFGYAGQSTAGHDDELAAQLFNGGHLKFISSNHLVYSGYAF